MSESDIKTRRWRRLEYERLVEAGFFPPGDRIELLAGHLVVAEPQGSGHFATIRAVEEALRAAFGRGWEVRAQGPLALDDDSEPEPDVAVVPGSFLDYTRQHPSRPVLVVEVSESSLMLDREHKGSVYARGGVADYWIVNLVGRVLEVYREPTRDPDAPFGWRYAALHTLGRERSIAPLALPHVAVRVSDLLP